MVNHLNISTVFQVTTYKGTIDGNQEVDNLVGPTFKDYILEISKSALDGN